VIRKVPSGNVAESDATISVDVAEITVSGCKSIVTTGVADAWPRPSWPRAARKFWPAIVKRPFDASNVALMITSCGDWGSAGAAVAPWAHQISAASARTVVDHRLRSTICEPPGLTAEVCKMTTTAVAIWLTHSIV
jgi:hypothetical protein